MMKKASKSARKRPATAAASRLIDARISELVGWRGETLARVRTLITQALPGVVEEWKWDVPVWSSPTGGIICTGETYKAAVKLTFPKGASLDDPAGLFNASLEGKARRAIDVHEGDKINSNAFKALIRAAAANAPIAPKTHKPAKPKLLSGGNPQIAKADGNAPVQAYIDAMPGWKRDVGRRLDTLITRIVPGVRKAVKWNSPFYGTQPVGPSPTPNWFLAIHCFKSYIKVAFFRGTSLEPMPPGSSKQKEVRYLNIHLDGTADQLDDKQFVHWVKQASRLPT